MLKPFYNNGIMAINILIKIGRSRVCMVWCVCTVNGGNI